MRLTPVSSSKHYGGSLLGGSFEVHLVLGSAVRAQDVVDDRTDEWLTVSQFVGDMPAALACADMAVSAAGSTVYELMTVGVPGLVVAVAENQRAIARTLSQLRMGSTSDLRDRLRSMPLPKRWIAPAADALTRASMSAQGRETVDGRGALRVQTVMAAGLIQLRSAGVDDMRMIWRWANDASARAVSFSTAPIPWEDHVRWFGARLRDPRHRMLIAEAPGGAAVGGARMELAGEHAVMSVSIDRGSRGVGAWSMADPAGESGHPSRCRGDGCPCLHQARQYRVHPRVRVRGVPFSLPDHGAESTGSAVRISAGGRWRVPVTHTIDIAGRRVGGGEPVYMVAELSANHNQDFEEAVRLVHAAAECGADAVKLQTYTPDTLTIDCDREQFRIGKGNAVGGQKPLCPLRRGAHPVGVAAETETDCERLRPRPVLDAFRLQRSTVPGGHVSTGLQDRVLRTRRPRPGPRGGGDGQAVDPVHRDGEPWRDRGGTGCRQGVRS